MTPDFYMLKIIFKGGVRLMGRHFSSLNGSKKAQEYDTFEVSPKSVTCYNSI